MPEPTPEQAMRRACDALIQGDFNAALANLTPEAANEAISLAMSFLTLPLPLGYTIESHEETAGEHRYKVRFQTSTQDLMGSATWRLIDDTWRITSIRVEGL